MIAHIFITPNSGRPFLRGYKEGDPFTLCEKTLSIITYRSSYLLYEPGNCFYPVIPDLLTCPICELLLTQLYPEKVRLYRESYQLYKLERGLS